MDNSPLYDYKLISSRLASLKRARIDQDIPSLKLLVRSGLLRNLGNICHPLLYADSLSATKTLIHEYLDQVVECIDYLARVQEPLLDKFDLFYNVSQSFGNTALILNGGATFGLFHLGTF